MSGPVSITRVAEPAELAVISRLAHTIWPAHYGPIIGEAQVAYMLEAGYAPEALATEQAAGTVFYLLWQDDTPAGYAAASPDGEDPRRTWLDKLYLLAEARGQGHGRALVARVVADAKAAGTQELALRVNRHNAASIAFYERLGLVIAEADVKDIGHGFVMDDYIMQARLADLEPLRSQPGRAPGPA